MEFEQKRKEEAAEALEKQKDKIVIVEQQVVRSIWSKIPKYSSDAYNILEGRFLEGQDVKSYDFWEKEQNLIRQSARGLGAKIRQTFVEEAFADLLKKLSQKEDLFITELFPDVPEETQKPDTILDVYSFEPAILILTVEGAEEQARHDIVSVVVEKEERASSGLIVPSEIIVLPTLMEGVSLRYRPTDNPIEPIVEFVAQRVA